MSVDTRRLPRLTRAQLRQIERAHKRWKAKLAPVYAAIKSSTRIISADLSLRVGGWR